MSLITCSVSLHICDGLAPGESCYQKLSNGTFDIMVAEQPSSMYEGSNGTILSLYPYRAAKATIVSPYDCSLKTAMDMSRKTDITDSVSAFQTQTWLLIASFILIVAFLINVHLRMNRIKFFSPSTSGLWSMFASVFKNPSFRDINWNSRLLTLITTFAVLIIGIGYFENLLKCDQMATYQPPVYTSFEQLSADTDAKVLGRESMMKVMKSHPIGSVYRNIHEAAVRSGFEHQPTWSTLIEFLMSRKNARNKAVINDYPRATDTLCGWIRDNAMNMYDTDGLCFHEHIPELDSSEGEFHERYLTYPKARHISNNFTRKKIFDKWHKLFKRSFEMYLIQMQTVYRPIITPGIADCVAKKLPVTHSPDPAAFKLFYYRNVLMALMIVLSLAVIALIVEHLFVERFPIRPVIRKKRIIMEIINQNWEQVHRTPVRGEDIVSQVAQQVQTNVPKQKVTFKSVVIVAEINRQVPCNSTVLTEVHSSDYLPPVEI